MLLSMASPELVWIVSGSNGENRIEARGATQDEAWRNAVLQAEAVGKAGKRQLPAASVAR
jgi:hypothetical protein